MKNGNRKSWEMGLAFLGLSATLGSNAAHAEMSNGTDRGGGGTQAAMVAMLPKSIYQRGITYFGTKGYKPIVKRGWCGDLYNCDTTAEAMTVDVELRLKMEPRPHYEPHSLKARYLLDRKWHALPTRINVTREEWVKLGIEHGGSPMQMKIQGILWWGQRNEFLGPFPDRLLAPEKQYVTPNQFTEYRAARDPERAWGTVQLWLDGVEAKPGVEKLSARLQRIRETLASQLDLTTIEKSREATRDIVTFNAILRDLDGLMMDDGKQELAGHSSFDPTYTIGVDGFLHFRMEQDKARLLALGQSAVSSDGTCDTRKYSQLVAQLGAWKLGSAAYFYELDCKPGDAACFTAEGQLKASGLRQKLRVELNRWVVPYCEPALGGRASQAELLLNE